MYMYVQKEGKIKFENSERCDSCRYLPQQNRKSKTQVCCFLYQRRKYITVWLGQFMYDN